LSAECNFTGTGQLPTGRGGGPGGGGGGAGGWA